MKTIEDKGSKRIYRKDLTVSLNEIEYSVVYETFLTFSFLLPVPSCFLYFYAPYEEIRKRIIKRGRIIEKEYDDYYMFNLFQSFEELFYELKGHVNAYKINTYQKSKEEVLQHVLFICSDAIDL